MKRQNKLSGIKQGDMIVLGLLCALCVLLFVLPVFVSSDEKTAVVMLDGEVYETVELSENESRRIEVSGCVLIVENKTVRFESADCPDKLCVKTAALTRVGDTAACVPNKVVVTLRGKNKNNYDMVAY